MLTSPKLSDAGWFGAFCRAFWTGSVGVGRRGGSGCGCGRRGQGRGSRATALRSARVLTVSPISASSAAAWAAVPRTCWPCVASGRGAAGVGGTPGGWAGWGRRSGRRRVARVGGATGCAVSSAAGIGAAGTGCLRRPGLVKAADALLVAPRVRAAVRLPDPDPCLVDAEARLGAAADRGPAGAAACWAAELSAGATAARLSLRRCGRRRGSAPRTSDGRSSLKDYIMAHPGRRRSTRWPIMSDCRRS